MSSVANLEIEIVNDALALVGHGSIHNFDGDSPASETAERLFPLVLNRLLDSYPWRFAMRHIQLAQLSEAAPAGWKYRHKLPPSRDGVPRRYYQTSAGSTLSEWEIFGDDVCSNASVVYCDYVDAGGLTGTFRDLLVRALAADFAIALCDDRGLKDRYQQEAFGSPAMGGRGGLFKTAISNDAQGAGPRQAFSIGRGPLIDAHNGVGMRGRRRDVGSL